LLADAMRADKSLQVVASAPSSQELLDAVSRVPIDVAVISFALDNQPGRGLEVLRQMRALRPEIKGVILLDSSSSQEVLDCFRAGAKGIFSKHEPVESLSKCIHCVYEGQIWARSVELELALEALASSPVVRATNHHGIELLSVRERQVIQYLSSGMTNKEIAAALGLSRHTVKNYLFRIFDKVGVSSRTELLYLTMNNAQSRAEDSTDTEADKFPALLKAAEAGLAWAQLQLAEHYSQTGKSSDAVAAYMWFLLCQKAIADMHDEIEAGKKSLGQDMSTQQVAEAERKAAEWLAEKKIRSGFVVEIDKQHRKAAGASRS
jgi:DNA-binding NarL/FixJ family response regulator